MDDLAECLRLHQSGKTDECISNLSNVLAAHPDDPEAGFLFALINSRASIAAPENGLLDDLLLPNCELGDVFEEVGHDLRASGLEELALLAFKVAGAKEKEFSSWGDKPFNGQEKRSDLFRGLLRLIDFGAIVETGTFRGSTTLFLHECSGLDVYSCELSDRYFFYASERLAGFDGIHLCKGDSRTFLAQLGEDARLTEKIVFFYLDAHWNADLPLVQELQLILQNFKSPIVMIDDFEVPHRDDYAFDDYGGNAILSLDILESVLTADMSLFYPAWPPAQDSNQQRGFVILAQGELAQRVGTLTEYLREFDRFGAALEQMQRYRRMFREVSSKHEATKNEAHQTAIELQKANTALEQTKIEREQAGIAVQTVESDLRQSKVDLQETNLARQTAAERVAELERRVADVEQSRAWHAAQWLSKQFRPVSSLWRRR
jgi:predicted O-methyltransferase YrrM